MCIRYECYRCKATKIWRCEAADWYEWTPACPEMRHENLRRKCTKCEFIKEAIRSLRDLVFRQPWLETEGTGGEPKDPTWEENQVAEPQATLINWNHEVDNELRDRIAAMGLEGLEGQENLNDGHGLANGSDNNNNTQDEDKNTSTDVEESHGWGSDEGTLATEASGEPGKEGENKQMKEEQNGSE